MENAIYSPIRTDHCSDDPNFGTTSALPRERQFQHISKRHRSDNTRVPLDKGNTQEKKQMPYIITKAEPISRESVLEIERRYCMTLLETLYAKGFLTCEQKQLCIERENSKYRRMQEKETFGK